MKIFVILSLIAAASAQFGYPGFYSAGHHFGGFYKPLTYHSHSAGGVSNTVQLGKREADPLMYYSGVYPTTYSGYYPYASHVYTPSVYGYNKPVVHAKSGVKADDSVTPFGYAAKGMYYANSAGTIHKAKREANHHMFYNAAFPVAYTGYSHYMPQAYAFKPMHYKTYSNDFVSDKTYAAKGQYHAVTAGSEHIAKREAEPYSVYSGFGGYYPYTSTYSHFGGYGYPYSTYHY